MTDSSDLCHPTQEQLAAFALGKLNRQQSDWVERHLPNCPKCLGQMQTSPSIEGAIAQTDPLIALLRESSIVSAPATMEDDPANAAYVPRELRDHARYRTLRRLGSGGMGCVYLAEHRLLERLVAIKIIRPDLINTPELLKRFQREARLVGRLAHPNVVAVYEAEQSGANAMLVMEYVAGETFAELFRSRGPTPVSVACELIRWAANGLQHIHEQNLVHRDIKPSNLILTSAGEVKILDLGLAFLKTENDAASSELTRPEQSIGTVSYTAPEQWENSRSVDIRGDIYSLGCTFYFLLCGLPPFASEGGRTVSLIRQLWAHSSAPVPDVRDARPEVPEAIAMILRRMLAKRPEERFQIPIHVASALTPFVADTNPAAYLTDGTTPARPVLQQPDTALPAAGTIAQNRPPSRLSRIIGAATAALSAGGARVARRSSQSQPVTINTAMGAPSGPPIKVGVLHSLTGTMAISERPVVDAVLLAIDELNASGGLLGRPVEAVVADGASEGALFAIAAEKLICSDQVVTVFGCWTSASRRTVRPVFEKHNHLLFYPVQYEGLEQSPNIVYTGAAPNQQILPALRWCTTVLNKKRFFLVGSDYVFPRCANAIMRDCASILGAEIVGEAYLPLDSQDPDPIISQIEKVRPDMILNTINGDSNLAFYRAMRPLRGRLNDLPIMSFSIEEEELRSLNASDIAGDYAAWNYFMSIDRKTNHDFLRRFHDRYGTHRIVTDPMEAAYFGVHLWAQAVRQAGVADVESIRREIGGQTMEAPQGTVTIDPVTKHTFKLVRIGKIIDSTSFEVVYTSEKPIAPEPYPATRTPAAWQQLLNDLYLGWNHNWARPRDKAPETDVVTRSDYTITWN